MTQNYLPSIPQCLTKFAKNWTCPGNVHIIVALSPGILVHHRTGHYVEFAVENYENPESFC